MANKTSIRLVLTMLKMIKSFIGRTVRALYHGLPVSTHAKWRLKSFFYRWLGFLIRNTATYRHWRGQQAVPPLSVAEEPVILPPAMIEIERENIAELAAGIRFECWENPRVSVVIPVFNKVEYTVCCLASMGRYPPEIPFEIIVVDDGSTDETERWIKAIPNIRYVRNQRNLGFLRSSNQGAALARGHYVMLLNNDTQVFSGWLDALVQVFADIPDTGIAGSKLIYPSGHLQEAGAALKKDGAVQLIGLNDDPTKPEWNILREVDHCSGASLLIEKSLWQRLGGFDEYYAPAYYEDCDLSLRVRKQGKKVIYQPASVVMHHLSITTNALAGEKMRQIELNRQKYLQRWQSTLRELDRVKAIAFYLPQYHPIPENDRWWGKGFTEWTNVTKAKPNFEGHYQPQLPLDLGFYDLRVPEVREEQAELARRYGIYGFCYYYYWFAGKRLLHRPLDEVLESGKPNFPFCICWANENWSRRWDGRDSEILIAQNHSDTDDVNFIKSLIPAFLDKRYIRINGKPLLLVYRISLLPDPARTAQIWRQYCRNAGIGELYLATVQSFGIMDNPKDFGFDAAVEFPPHEMAVVMDPPSSMLNPKFAGMFYDYIQTAHKFMHRPLMPYPFYRTVMPAWDNTARRQDNSDIFLNTHPAYYENWLRYVVEQTRAFKPAGERIVFINAWNEWAEGNHLEPDRKFGHGYLEATRQALGDLAEVSADCEENAAPDKVSVDYPRRHIHG